MRAYKYLRLKNYLNEAGTPLCASVSRFELYVVEWLAAQAVGWGWLIYYNIACPKTQTYHGCPYVP